MEEDKDVPETDFWNMGKSCGSELTGAGTIGGIDYENTALSRI